MDSLQLEPATKARNHYRIYMIPGNPGLISFYKTFLTELKSHLADIPDTSFTLEGQSLGGFSVGTSTHATSQRPLSLQEQILHVESSAIGARHISSDSCNAATDSKEKVILIGHSVGSYILLELLRRHNEQRRDRDLPYSIVAGILLFPTVVDLAKSPSGRRAGWLLKLPYLAIALQMLVNFLVAVLPDVVFSGVVRAFTRFPPDGVEAVVSFLKSPVGVTQAL